MLNPWLQLTRLPREARDTLFLLAVIGIVVAPQVPNLPWWCSTLTAVVLLWRGTLAVQNKPLPNRWYVAALVILVGLGAWFSHRTLLGREAGVTLVVALLALKTLELRARRDAFVVFFLGFFVLLTHFFQSQSLLMAVAILIALLGLLTGLINAHRPVGQPRLIDSASLAAKMALAGAPLMVALFVLFPRFAPLWGLPSDAQAGRTGLSSDMQVGSVAKLALDDSIAFRIKFDSKIPAQNQMYFRGPVLSQLDGQQWRMLQEPNASLDNAAPLLTDLQVTGEPIAYEVTLEANQQPWLMVLDAAAQAPSLPDQARARMTPDLQWLAPRPVTDILRYRAQSHPQFTYGLKPQGQFDATPFLRMPVGANPRTNALAQQLLAQSQGDANALIAATLERLRTGGYTYTLEPGTYGRDTADEFWFDKKAGFCEHIASSFVILMRAAGVPARIVTGYQGGELNSVDNYWVVRNADAHAWAEVWHPRTGWTRIDPTAYVAPARIGQLQRLRAPGGLMASTLSTLSPTALAQLRTVWEAINNRWNQSVLNYTQGRQLDLLKQLGFSSPSWIDLIRVMGLILLAAALIGTAWVAWERRQHDPWLRLLQRNHARLAKLGLDIPHHTPPRTLAAQLRNTPQVPPDLSHALIAWLHAMDKLRYAPQTNSSAMQRAALRALTSQWRQLPWPTTATRN